jgi:hypothetical protein
VDNSTIRRITMKKLLAAAAVAIIVFTSCASMMASSTGMYQEDPAYKIVPENSMENRAVATIVGSEYLKKRENKKAEVEKRKPNYESIPNFGYILIKITGWTANTANPKNWLFIISDANNNEIYRSYGIDSVPKVRINDIGGYYNSSWSNYNTILLENEPVYPLYLRVVSPDNTPIDITIKKR